MPSAPVCGASSASVYSRGAGAAAFAGALSEADDMKPQRPSTKTTAPSTTITPKSAIASISPPTTRIGGIVGRFR